MDLLRGPSRVKDTIFESRIGLRFQIHYINHPHGDTSYWVCHPNSPGVPIHRINLPRAPGQWPIHGSSFLDTGDVSLIRSGDQETFCVHICGPILTGKLRRVQSAGLTECSVA